MQKFEYRTPRFSVDLPVKFIVENTTLSARSKDIGKEGMTIEIRESLQPEVFGTIVLSYQGRGIEIRARVAHVEGAYAGLEFLPESDAERTAVAQFVASLATAPVRSGPVLLH